MPLTDNSKTLRKSSNSGVRLTSKQKRREKRRERTNAYIERSRQPKLREENDEQLNYVPDNKQINVSGIPVNTTRQVEENLPAPKLPLWKRWFQR
jgi:hypothetical protein